MEHVGASKGKATIGDGSMWYKGAHSYNRAGLPTSITC